MLNFQRDQGVTIDSLRQMLERAGISTAEWGKGTAKTLHHLVQEIESGESALAVTREGILRNVVVGGADVYYTSPTGERFRLKEDRQVFTDGRERRRDLSQSVSEKMKSGENPFKAMIRGIQEELGITGAIRMTDEGTSEATVTSPSYPGLNSRYINHKFRAELSDEQFKPDGYVEVQSDKSTYFVWDKI